MKKCQKLILGVCLAIGLAIAFTGCGSAPVVFDKSVPLEQSSTIRINNYTYVSANINGKPVEWITSSFNQKQVIIPAGEHTFRIGTDTNRRQGLVLVTKNFLPGHTYFVIASILGSKVYGAIIDEAEFNSALVPDSTSPDASPIEGKWNYTDGKNTNEFIFAKDTFVRSFNGTPMFKGFFQINGNTGAMLVFANYDSKNEKWRLLASALSGGNLTYNGTSLRWGNFELQKVE